MRIGRRTAVVIAFVLLFRTLIPAAHAQTVAAKDKAASTKWTPPRTAFGQPDLQGIWANNNATPLERLKEFGDRALLTDEEVARLQKRADEIFGNGADAAFGDDFFKAALAEDPSAASASSRSFDKVTGNYSAVWLVEREFDRRTSLITDPPSGRTPPMTAEAQERQKAAAARYGVGLGATDGP